MFVNFDIVVNNRDTILYNMKHLQYIFHLTGSRLFGNDRDDSDYDFFVVDDCGLQTELHRLGFSKISRSGCGYNDPSVESIYRHRCGIDVQIINADYFETKLKVNSYLNTDIGRRLLEQHKTKWDRLDLWSFLIQLAK